MGIGIDCIGCCKSNYHTIKSTTAPDLGWIIEECFNCYKQNNVPPGDIELTHIRCKSNHHINWTMASATVTYHRICNKTGATSGAGTAYPFGAPAFTPTFHFLVGSCYLIISFLCSALQIVVCFLLFFNLAIVLAVRRRFTDSDYSFGIVTLFLHVIAFILIFWLLYISYFRLDIVFSVLLCFTDCDYSF